MSEEHRRAPQGAKHAKKPSRRPTTRRSQEDYMPERGQRRRPQGQGGTRPVRDDARRPHPQQRRRPQQASKGQAQRRRRPNDATHQPQAGAARQQAARRSANRKQRSASPIPIVAIVVAALVLGIGGFFLVRTLTTKHVTVNGQAVTMARSATPRTLVEDGIVTTTPGNLMAVDGSLIAKGEGDVCFATADGHPIGVDEEIPPNAVVEVGDGHDTTEEYDEQEEAIPFEKASGDTSFSGYWTGAIHLLSEGKDGVQVTRTGKRSGIKVNEVKQPAVDAGYVIYSAKPDDKVIALTFDDGPWPQTTDEILDVLEENNAKATFFTIGEQISGHEDTLKRAVQMGCEICTHTWDHAAGSGEGVNIGYMTASQQVQEVEKGYKSIADALGEEPPHILRAPGGNFNNDTGNTIDNLWDYVDAEIGWDVDTEDWKAPGSDSISKMILSATPGNVILMHDGGGDRSQTVAALREALPQLVAQGYSFVTVSELLAYGMPSGSASSSSSTSTTSSASSSDSSTSSSTSSSTDATSDADSSSDSGDSTSSYSSSTSNTSTSSDSSDSSSTSDSSTSSSSSDSSSLSNG